MSEHIINFAVSIEDEAIADKVEDYAMKKITRDLEEAILDKLFETYYYGQKPYTYNRDGSLKVDSGAKLTDFTEGLVKKLLDDNREEIIDKAAEKIAEYAKRSKAFKEKLKEV